MKKILIPIVLLMGVSCTTQKEVTQTDFHYKFNFSEAINNIQDMKEWMLEDQKQGIIDSVYAEYYIEYLNASEDLLLEISHYNVNTKQNG